MITEQFKHNSVMLIIHLAAQGKLDRLDLQILAAQSEVVGIGYKRIGKMLGVPVSTIQSRVKKISTLIGA